MSSSVDNITLSQHETIDSPVGLQEAPSHLKTVALRAYGKQKDRSMSDEEITQYLPMVTNIVHKVVSYLRPPLSFEDLVSAGTIGLVKAARDFQPTYGAKFQTYAYIRIKGAILDELRNASLLPSNLNRQVKEAQALLEARQAIFTWLHKLSHILSLNEKGTISIARFQCR